MLYRPLCHIIEICIRRRRNGVMCIRTHAYQNHYILRMTTTEPIPWSSNPQTRLEPLFTSQHQVQNRMLRAVPCDINGSKTKINNLHKPKSLFLCATCTLIKRQTSVVCTSWPLIYKCSLHGHCSVVKYTDECILTEIDLDIETGELHATI